jgi:transcriptional regulator with XRE-family HTH domain
MQPSAKRRVHLGATGEQVRSNIRRLRERGGLSQAQLARLTTSTTRPLASVAINEIENGARRVDVDDLVSLAAALGVNPNALLMPDKVGEDYDVELSGIGTINSSRAWQWARGYAPVDQTQRDVSAEPESDIAHAAFRMRIEPRSLPPRHAVVADRTKWIQEQTFQLALDLPGAGSERDAEGIKRQLDALRNLDPEDDGQWSALNDQR